MRRVTNKNEALGLQELFGRVRALRGFVSALLEREAGQLWVTTEEPTACVGLIDFCFVVGECTDINLSGVVELIHQLRNSDDVLKKLGCLRLVCDRREWFQRLWDAFGNFASIHRREAFRLGKLQIEQLLFTPLTGGRTLELVAEPYVNQLGVDLHPSLIWNFESAKSFVEKGCAVAVRQDGRFIAAASTGCVSSVNYEVQLRTHEDFRRQGLATSVARALIQHCQTLSIAPSWDAANDASSRIAKRLGFVSEGKYSVIQLEKQDRSSPQRF